MDPLTHAMSGALLARATASTHPNQSNQTKPAYLPLHLQVATGLIAAVFPDVDFVLRLIDTLTYLNWHQGPTHSLILLPFWAWLLAHVLARTIRSNTVQQYSWQHFYRPACLGFTAHIAGDLITSYGLMLFSPFSTERYALPLAFVIDPWFSLIIFTGLIASWRYPNHRTTAIIALCGLLGYLIFLYMLRSQALNIAENHARTLSNSHISALPQPLSPFHWQLIIRQNDRYHVMLVDLSQNSNHQHAAKLPRLLSRINAAYQSPNENNWRMLGQFGNNTAQFETMRKAWLHPVFEPFRMFAQYPLLKHIDHSNGTLCYWFYDMRFKFPELPPSFQFGLCRQDATSRWQIVRHRGLFYID